jgi:hypothetical protein
MRIHQDNWDNWMTVIPIDFFFFLKNVGWVGVKTTPSI